MVEGTAFSYDGFRMHDDTTKVMDAYAWPYRGLGWNGNPGRDLNKTLDEKAQRLGGDTALVAPPKDTVDE